MIKIIIDGICDLPQEMIDRYDMHVVPLKVIVDEVEYIAGVELKNDAFYRLLKQGKKTKTSQATPMQFVEVYQKFYKYDHILYIGSSSTASGTFQSGVIAKQQMDHSNKVTAFDSMLLSMATGLMAVQAGRMIEQGEGLETILQKMEAMKAASRAYVYVDSLEYLKRGGRITGAKAMVGTVLNMKPILTIKNGLIEQLDTVRGRKKAIQTLLEYAKSDSDLSNETIGIAHSLQEEDLKNYIDLVQSALQPKEIIVAQMGPVVGTHIGPDVRAVFIP